MAAVIDAESDEKECNFAAPWMDAAVFDNINSHSVLLSLAVGVDMIKVEATPSKPTAFKFMGVFGDDELLEAGFCGDMTFEERVHVIHAALGGEISIIVSLTANDSDGIDLDIVILPMVDDVFHEHKLRLDRVPLRKDIKVAAEVCESNQKLAAARIDLEEISTALKDTIVQGDAAKQQLAVATYRIAELSKEITVKKESPSKSALRSHVTAKQLCTFYSELWAKENARVTAICRAAEQMTDELRKATGKFKEALAHSEWLTNR